MCQVDWIIECPGICLNVFVDVPANEAISKTESTFWVQGIAPFSVGGHHPMH